MALRRYALVLDTGWRSDHAGIPFSNPANSRWCEHSILSLRLPRIIPRLDIKGKSVVKGIHMEGLRVVGDPAELASKYAEEGADEIFYSDCVASLYGRNQLDDLLREATRHVFVPITVAGGIRSRADAQRLLDAGADSIAINTAAIRAPDLISDLARYYGSQAITVSIEAKRVDGGWECFTDSGRERTGKDAVAWAHESVARGAGSILLTSIDQEGTRKGFEHLLLRAVADLPVPVIICGGMGCVEHLNNVKEHAHGIAMASCLHYGKVTISEMRRALGQETVEEVARLPVSRVASV